MSEETQSKAPEAGATQAPSGASHGSSSGSGSERPAPRAGGRPSGGPGGRGKFFRRKKVCTTHQRRLTRAIKQARNIALLPFATRH